MPLPKPEIGLVINYAYLWEREAEKRHEEGKNRPCLIVHVEDRAGKKLVTVQPITTKGEAIGLSNSVEIPLVTKSRLGLDHRRSWIITNESNQFIWPGPDLGAISSNDGRRYAYGFMPQKITDEVIRQGQQNMIKRTLSVVDRDTSPPKIEKL